MNTPTNSPVTIFFCKFATYMRKSIKIFIASFVGLLVFFGGISKFHHHIDGAEICFCSNLLPDSPCNLHNDESPDPAPASSDAHHHGDDKDSCPLHLDNFIVTVSQHLDTPLLHCHHVHCDLCYPKVHIENHDETTDNFSPDIVPLLKEGHYVYLSRRGPPVC